MKYFYSIQTQFDETNTDTTKLPVYYRRCLHYRGHVNYKEDRTYI